MLNYSFLRKKNAIFIFVVNDPDHFSKSNGHQQISQLNTFDGSQHGNFKSGSNGSGISKLVKGKMYYDYSKRQNHSCDTCQKLHGHLDTHKDKYGNPIANHVIMNTTPGNETQAPMISPKQISQLLHMLNQLPTTNVATTYAGTSFCLNNSISNDIWIIDSGASDHIIYNQSYFLKNTPTSSPISIRMPNGNVAPTTHVGMSNWQKN